MNLKELKKIAERCYVPNGADDQIAYLSPFKVEQILQLINNYEKAVEVLKFYGDENNWDGTEDKFKTEIVSDDWDITDEQECDDGLGGKLARQTLKELGEL